MSQLRIQVVVLPLSALTSLSAMVKKKKKTKYVMTTERQEVTDFLGRWEDTYFNQSPKFLPFGLTVPILSFPKMNSPNTIVRINKVMDGRASGVCCCAAVGVL